VLRSPEAKADKGIGVQVRGPPKRVLSLGECKRREVCHPLGIREPGGRTFTGEQQGDGLGDLVDGDPAASGSISGVDLCGGLLGKRWIDHLLMVQGVREPVCVSPTARGKLWRHRRSSSPEAAQRPGVARSPSSSRRLPRDGPAPPSRQFVALSPADATRWPMLSSASPIPWR
jgi:hypothetical protein